MDITTSATQCKQSRIYNLPNEILEQIMCSLDGIPKLYAFVTADPQVKLVEARPEAILGSVIGNWSMASQFQNMLCNMLLIRQRLQSSLHDSSLQDFLDTHLDNHAAVLASHVSSFIQQLGPMPFLRNVAQICTLIAQAEESFIKTQLPKTADRIRHAVERSKTFPKIADKFRFCAERVQLRMPISCPSSGSLEPAPSSRELYRIRRALWRLYLYFGVFFSRQSLLYAKRDGDRPDQIDLQRAFFHQLTVWELEEMDCVYCHLKNQSQVWKVPCPYCDLLCLPDELSLNAPVERLMNLGVHHLAEDHQTYPQVSSGGFAANFEFAFNFFREWLYCWDKFTAWPDSPKVHSPNAGYLYVRDHHRDFGYSEPFESRMDSMIYLLGWGYCIWDRSRLEAWHLVDNPTKGLQAMQKWWWDC